MTDGKTVARRSTRAFTEDCGPSNIEKITSDSASHKRTSNTVERQGRPTEKQRQGHSRSSSSSSVTAAEFVNDLSEGVDVPLQEISSDVSVGPEDPKSGREKKTPGYPINFGTIIPGLYRSGYPQLEDYKFLGTLGLKTVLTLVEKTPPEGYEAFMKSNGIKHVVINMEGTKKVAIPALVMISIMEVVLDRRNYPMLVHCNHGKHRTGCVAAVVRKVMGWTAESAIQEYKQFADPKAREVDIEYITTYETSGLNGILDYIQRRDNAPHGPPLILWASSSMVKMGRMLLFTGAVLCLWAFTFTNWQA
ncbi:MAG: hypothetical protein M1818_006731 [Claussenomyces sp. TS43310]|nr:MAG: hypothetical protein M1818_006731 [Claussenomyces sp. TS43310]